MCYHLVGCRRFLDILVLVVMLLLWRREHIPQICFVHVHVRIRLHHRCSGQPVAELGGELKLFQIRWPRDMLL